MKIVSHDLALSSQLSQEKVLVDQSLNIRDSSASAPPAVESIQLSRQLNSEEIRFHKAVVSEFLLRLSESGIQTFEEESLRQNMTEVSSIVVEKGRLIDSQNPARQTPGIQVIQERLTSIARERLDFSAQGVVQTKTKKISIDLSFSMSRNQLSDQAIVNLVKDPLVINFDTDVAQLSEKRFFFDIDNDGLSDQISLLKKGSGFLALDRNGDGRINNGKELFGAQSGNGFSELGQYDADGNGWIDANDPIFDQLRIWIKDDTGADRLVALGEVGIGAIFLDNADTLFSLTDAGNSEALGILKQSGIFLKNNGDVGTVQNIDFVIKSGEAMQAENEAEEAARAAMPDYESFAVESERPATAVADLRQEQREGVASGVEEKRASLQQELVQLRSRLNHILDGKEMIRINGEIARVKSELSAVETQALQQLFNTLA